MLVDEDSWEQICKGLLDKGVCALLPLSQVYHLNQRPLFSGLFAVTKDEMAGDWKVFRLIMNMIPLNKLCRSLGGDISALPSWSGMSAFVLEDSEVVVMSSEDIRCFFYLFSLPPSWLRFMCFGKPVPASVSGVCSEPHYLAARVLPMGFLNTVAIAQHIHRRISRIALHGIVPGVGPQNEVRKDRVFPSCDLFGQF